MVDAGIASSNAPPPTIRFRNRRRVVSTWSRSCSLLTVVTSFCREVAMVTLFRPASIAFGNHLDGIDLRRIGDLAPRGVARAAGQHEQRPLAGPAERDADHGPRRRNDPQIRTVGADPLP